MVDAYGGRVKVEQTKQMTKTLGGNHAVLSFVAPAGYARPKTIIHMDLVHPCYTDMCVVMKPFAPEVEAPGIDDLQMACKLNLRGAATATVLGGKQLASWISWEEPLKMKMDRGWFKTLKEPGSLLDALNKTGSMVEVPGSLHHPHKPNFELVASFKSKHRVPVFQVTLWRDLGEWVAELDIDLRKGMGHWREVIENNLTGGQTHPYLVNQFLAWYWGIITFKLSPTGIEGERVAAP